MFILCAVGFMGIDSKSEHGRAVGLLCATAVLWSFGGILIKVIPWNPMAIAGGRSILAAAVMLLVVRRRHLSWSFDQVGGAVCYAANVVLFVVATKMTTAANASIHGAGLRSDIGGMVPEGKGHGP